MKKYLSLGIILLIVLSFSSCQKEKKQPEIIKIEPEEAISLTATSEPEEINSEDSGLTIKEKYGYLDSIDVSIEKGDNYEIFSDIDHTGYKYEVINNDGDIIDENYNGWRYGVSFENKDDLLILHQGLSGSAFRERYYDVSNNRVSRFYFMPVDTSKELVAYFELMGDENTLTLIVQNMFDSSIYYQEITGDFSVLDIRLTKKAEFLENNTKIKLTYWLWQNNEEVTEIIELN